MDMNEKGIAFFWENYHRAFQWQNSSKLCHWQARARALELENAYLRNFIQEECHLSPFRRKKHRGTSVRGKKINGSKLRPKEENNCDSPAEDHQLHSDPEIREDLLAFYEKTIRHKIERKKRQSEDQKGESEDSHSENEKISSMGPVTSARKSSEMDRLYGLEAPKILSMELSMQINFDMNRNNSNAQLWPNIPLRLS